MPRVSVVIPTYNNAEYLLDALESVFAQTFADYEIVVVDDGSTDATRDLLTPYAVRLRYHYQPNQGLAVARNVGLALAKGEYITYLDGDDRWDACNLAAKVKALEVLPELGGVFSEFRVFDASGTTHERGTADTFPVFDRTGRTIPAIFPSATTLHVEGLGSTLLRAGNVFEALFCGNFILPSSMVFHRERALATGEFRPHMRTQQDYEYWLRFSRRHPLGFFDEPLVSYRRHPQQLTNFRNIERILLAVEEIVAPYEDEFTRLGRARLFNWRKADLLASLAKMHLRKGERNKARRRLVEAVRRNPGVPGYYLLYAATFIPPRALGALHRLASR